MKKVLCCLMALFILIAMPVFAQKSEADNSSKNSQADNQTSVSKCEDDEICINNPLAADSPQALIGYVINNILGIVGSLALVMFIFGGIIWMTSSGSADKIKKGRDILIWSIIGLVVIFSAYALVRFVIQGVGA